MKILREAGIEEWGSLSMSWSPWYQDRPTIEAEVIQPNGERSQLDPQTIEESGLRSGDPLLYEDRRGLRAPLPNLRVGAEIDFQISVVDREPYFAGGALGSFDWGDYLRVEESQLEIIHPADRPLHLETLGLNPTIEERISDGLRHVQLRVGALDPLESSEPDLPPDRFPTRRSQYSLVPSWAMLASEYAALVERQLKGVALEPILVSVPGEGSPTLIANAALAAIQAKVRYTGLEFGQQAIVPARPDEVVKRGFGDCKDQALLLVAVLRARRLSASVALVQASRGATPSDQVPGLNAFDHAIVYVDSDPPLWIDPTVDGLPVGPLPPYLQGAKALIAQRKTQGLTTLPTARSEESTQRWSKDIYLPSFGPGRLEQEVTAAGWRGFVLKSAFRTLNPEERKERLKSELERPYGSGEITDSEFTPGDASHSPRLRFQAKSLSQAQIGDSDGQVPLSTPEVFQGLPLSVRHRRETGKVRQGDVLFNEAYRSEVTTRVHLPRGFVPRALPSDINSRLGPAFYTRQAVQKGDVVEVITSFDSGPRRWSAADLEAFNTALESLGESPVLRVDHAAMKAAASGRPLEALRLGRANVQQAPKDAVETARLSWIHGQIGFGREARSLAQRAVELDPQSFFARFYLGMALSADLFGQASQRGADRAAAIAAFKEAKRLGPDYTSARQSLGVLYERDADMVPYAPGADLDLAIAEFRDLQKTFKIDDFDLNLAWALLHAGRTEEAITEAIAAPAGPARNLAWAAAVAKSKGLAQAAEALRQGGVDPAEQERALLEAIRSLAFMRAYDKIRDAPNFLGASADLNVQGTVTLLAKVERHEDWAKRAPPAEVAALNLYRTIGERPLDLKALRDVVAKSTLAEMERVTQYGIGTATGLGELEPLYLEIRGAHAMVQAAGVPRRVGVDMMFATSECETTGDLAGGYRVIMTAPGSPHRPNFFVVEEEGRLKLRGWGEPAQLGSEALARVRRGDPGGARRWLAWARPLIPLDAEAASDVEPFVSLEGMEGDPDAEGAEILAASLMVYSTGTARQAIPILEGVAQDGSSRAMAAEHALGIAYDTVRDFKKSERIARAQLELEPDAKRPLRHLVRALVGLGRGPEARALLADRLSKRPKDQGLHRAFEALLADDLGAFEEAYRHISERRASQPPEPKDLNTQAWLSLFLPKPTNDAANDAIQAAKSTGYGDLAILHTLGCVYAASEQPAEAMKVVKELAPAGPGAPPSGLDHRRARRRELRTEAGGPRGLLAGRGRPRQRPGIDPRPDRAVAASPLTGAAASRNPGLDRRNGPRRGLSLWATQRAS